MENHFPDARVTHYKALIKTISLPDPNDRHILAVAIKSKAQYIITENLKDFPKKNLPLNIQAISMDQFLVVLINFHPTKVLEAVKNHRNSLTKPPYTAFEYIEARKNENLKNFVYFLEEHQAAI